MKKQYRSSLIATVHETAEGLHETGIMDKRTMREFDELCLTPVNLCSTKDFLRLRTRQTVEFCATILSFV